MTDIAQLSIAVDTAQVRTATGDLDALAKKGRDAEMAIIKFGAAAVLVGAGLVAAKIWEVNKSFESLNAGLVTVTKSQERANEIFEDLSIFAARTPYALREVTDAYTMLRVRGLDPSLKSMESLGNLASARQRSLKDVVMAVGSLSAGEIEPMKQLGFSVQTIGEKVRISMGDMAVTASKSSYEIGQAVAKISDSRFGDGMARQAKTLEGAWSNLGDTVDMALYKLGQGGSNDAVRNSILGITDAIQQATPQIVDFGNKAITGSISAAKFTLEHRDAVLALAGAYVAVRAGQGIGGIQQEFVNPKMGDDAGFGSKARGALDYVKALSLARIEEEAYAEGAVRSAKARLAVLESQNFVVAKSAEQIGLDQQLAQQELAVSRATTARAAAQEALNRAMAAQTAGTAAGGASRGQLSKAGEYVDLAQVRVQAADASLREEQAELRRLSTQRDAQVVDFASVATAKSRTLAQAELEVATGKLTDAQQRNTLASKAGEMAGRGFSAVVTALGGPVGATIAALGVLSIVGPKAYQALRSDTDKAYDSVEAYLVKLREEVALLDRKATLSAQGRQGEAGLGDEVVAKLAIAEKKFGEQQSALERAKADFKTYESVKGTSDYDDALWKVQLAQAALNKTQAEYNEIVSVTIRKRDEAAAKERDRATKSKDDQDEARRQSEAQLKAAQAAQAAQKIAEEQKAFLKDLKKDNLLGAAELASGEWSVLTKADEEAVKIKTLAEKYHLAGKELGEARERVRQIYEKAERERVQELDSEFRRSEIEGERSNTTKRVQALWGTFQVAAKGRQDRESYEAEVKRLKTLLAAGSISQTEYNTALAEAPARFLEAARAAKEFKDSVTQRYNPEGHALEQIKALSAIKAELDPSVYSRALIDLRKQASYTFEVIYDGAVQLGEEAADAFSKWASGIKDVEWNFDRMASSVLRNMARMYAQKGFEQLLGLMFSFEWGGPVTTTTSVFGDTPLDPIGTSSTSPISLPASGTSRSSGSGFDFGGEETNSSVGFSGPAPSITNHISVTIASDGSTKTDVQAGARGQDIAKSLESHMNQWALKNMRPGGLLRPVFGAR